MKKKISLLLTMLLVFSTSINNAKADTVYADGSGGGASGTATGTIVCEYGSFSDSTAAHAGNAIRITVVDKNGNRISDSIDLTNQASGTNLSLVTVKYTNGMPNEGTAFRMDGKHTRNEIKNGNAGNTYYANPVYNMYYWNKLPNFNYSGESNGGTILRKYFINNFASTDKEDMKKIFSLMNYNGYNDGSIYNNHYLLVEPLFYIITTTPNTPSKNTSTCDVKYKYYYGTGTEIFYMIKMRDGTGFWNMGSMTSLVYALGSRVHDTETVAGLTNAHGLVSGTTHVSTDKAISNYGLASMHVWMTDLIENKGESCTDKNNVRHYYVDDPSLSKLDFDNKYCPRESNYCTDANGKTWNYTLEPNLTKSDFDKKYCNIGNDDTCSFDLNISTTNDCLNGTSYQVIEDTNDWNCIYKQWNQPVDTFEGEFYNPNGDTQFADVTQAYSNPYCTVACRESVSYSFPGSFNVLAGGRFTIGEYLDGASTMGPITMRGTTTCNTGYNKNLGENAIDTNKFRNDYKVANDKVIETWDNYQIEVLRKELIDEVKKGSAGSANLVGQSDGVCSSTNGTHCYALTTTCCKANGVCNQTHYDNGIPGRCLGSNDPNYNNTGGWSQPANGIPSGYGYVSCTDNYSLSANNDSHTSHTIYTYQASGSYKYISRWGSIPITVTGYISSCGTHSNIPNNDAALESTKKAYEQAVAYRDNILKQLKACNNYQRTYSEFDPSITFIYNDDYYKKDYVLASNPTYESYTVYDNGSTNTWYNSSSYSSISSTYTADYVNVYGARDYIASWVYNIETKNMESINIAYPTNRTASQTTIKQLNFKLPNNLYRYATKNGISYNTIEEIIENNVIPGETDTTLIDTKKVRLSNGSSIPISKNKGECSDDYYIEYYYKDGTENLFGTSQKFLQYNKITTNTTNIVNGVKVSGEYGYKCNYNIVQKFYETQVTTSNTSSSADDLDYGGSTLHYVYSEEDITGGQYNYSVPNNNPMCSECINCTGYGDLNIIYRPISLGDPFPGESGNTRVPGENWQGVIENTSKSFVESYITNNRNVKTDDVYKLKPMYEFVLTPTNMRRIRQYNNKQKDDFNDDYTLNCYKNGDYCQSTFLEKGTGAGYFEFTKENPNGGTCFGANVTNWDTCRYITVGGS